MYRNGQETARMNNKDKGGLDMTETDITAPKGDIQGSRKRALPDIQVNLKGGT
jgi:hypothetical protein